MMKSFFLCSFALTMVLFTVGAALATAAPLPKGFLGHWHGVPTHTPVGPALASQHGFTFTVAPINENAWLMEDNFFKSNTLSGTQQQFWVNTNPSLLPGTNGSNIYCATLGGYFVKKMIGGGQVAVLEMVEQSENQMVWMYKPKKLQQYSIYFPWEMKWTLTLSDDSKTLRSEMLLPSGPDFSATHFLCNMSRVSDEPLKFLSESARESLAVAKANGGHPQSPCNVTMPPMPPSSSSSASSSSRSDNSAAALNEHQYHTASRCPHGFTARDGPIPEFVKLRMLEKRKQEQEEEKKKDDARLPPSKKQPLSSALLHNQGEEQTKYETCVLLNDYLDFKVRYNFNKQTQSVDVEVSARPPAEMQLAASEVWIAIGIMPWWPQMAGADVILGYLSGSSSSSSGAQQEAAQPPTGCVRSMYTQYSVGTPVENPSQIISQKRVWTEDNNKKLLMSFTRPWKTGHWDLEHGPVYNSSYQFLAAPQLMYAMGRAPSSCQGSPHYHYGARGIHGWFWPQASAAIPQGMFC